MQIGALSRKTSYCFCKPVNLQSKPSGKCWIHNSSKTYLAFETNQQKLGKFLENKASWNILKSKNNVK